MKIGDKINLKNITENNILSKKEVNGYEDQYFHKEDVNWIVFYIDKEKDEVLLIADKPLNQELTLQGKTGYLNFINELDRLCREITGVKNARSIREEDIINASLDNYDEIKDIVTKTEKGYWLASCCVYISSSNSYADFRVRGVSSSGNLNDYNLFYSNDISNSNSYCLRPVVSMKTKDLEAKNEM